MCVCMSYQKSFNYNEFIVFYILWGRDMYYESASCIQWAQEEEKNKKQKVTKLIDRNINSKAPPSHHITPCHIATSTVACFNFTGVVSLTLLLHHIVHFYFFLLCFFQPCSRLIFNM